MNDSNGIKATHAQSLNVSIFHAVVRIFVSILNDLSYSITATCYKNIMTVTYYMLNGKDTAVVAF